MGLLRGKLLIKFLLSVSLFSLFSEFAIGQTDLPSNLLKTNPYLDPIKPENRSTYAVNIRIISRGLNVDQSVIDQQVRAVNSIYSQCAGVNFQVNVVDQLAGAYTTDQDDLFAFQDGNIILTPKFFSFFNPWFQSRVLDAIDVHLVDFFSEGMRHPKNEGTGEIYLGQAIRSQMINWNFKDTRQNPVPTAVELAGDTTILALSLLEQQQGKLAKIQDRAKSDLKKKKYVYLYGTRSYNSSLMAHELGHILLETQNPPMQQYIDHYCPGLKDYCPAENVMSGGGSVEKTYVDAKDFSTVLGYTPLPQIEPEQCQALINHPLVKKIN